MHGEDLFVNDGSDGETVEAIRESLPKLDVVSTLALIVETVNAVDGSTLVVSSEDEEVLGVFDLVRQKKANGFERLLASIYIVAEEEIVGLGGETAILEQTQQIVVLAMNIATDLD